MVCEILSLGDLSYPRFCQILSTSLKMSHLSQLNLLGRLEGRELNLGSPVRIPISLSACRDTLFYLGCEKTAYLILDRKYPINGERLLSNMKSQVRERWQRSGNLGEKMTSGMSKCVSRFMGSDFRTQGPRPNLISARFVCVHFCRHIRYRSSTHRLVLQKIRMLPIVDVPEKKRWNGEIKWDP